VPSVDLSSDTPADGSMVHSSPRIGYRRDRSTTSRWNESNAQPLTSASGNQRTTHPVFGEQRQVHRLGLLVLSAVAQHETPLITGGLPPRATSTKTGFATSSTSNNTVRLRPPRSFRADSLGTYPEFVDDRQHGR
jgi:hypothetical protein